MKKLFLLVPLTAGTVFCASPPDLSRLTPVGAAIGMQRDTKGIAIQCSGDSQVRIEPLAADLVRVRASFGKKLEDRHSWAIAKTDWAPVSWNVDETPAAIVLSTAELEVAVQRSPLLVEFRDARTHRVLDRDVQPMLYDPRSGEIAAVRRLGFEEHFYGLGEKAFRLDRRRGRFSMWNTDAYHYKEGTDPLYQDIPFYIGLEDGAAFGLFFDNSYRTFFDFGASTDDRISFAAEGGPMDYYFFAGPSMKKIVGRYVDLTGHMPLPPRWALGHQQSRYSYYPDSRILEVAKAYRDRDLPLDVIHLDIDYMNGYRVFTWDPKRYPDPSGLVAKLKEQGVRVVTIVDPGVKYQPEKGYSVYDQGQAADYFLKRKDGRTYIGKVWPGEAVFVDYTKAAAARWWGDLFRAYTDHGVAGIWTDMNEPADFIDQTGSTQTDVITYDNGASSPYAANRNLFALHMARATYEGLAHLRPDQRPYVITRAGYAGIQRYSTMWTGDNTASWESLAVGIPMLASVGLSGEAFGGGDVGGFAGDSNAELLTRWYEAAFLAPFFRNHAELGSYDHEPWRFGTRYEDIIRRYLKLRYRLLPFLYSELEKARREGVPVFRPLVLNYQGDGNTVNLDDEFMIGDDLLAAPVLKPGQETRAVYLPRGSWIDYWTGRRLGGGQWIEAKAPLETVPLYVRGGAVLSLGPEMRWSDEKPVDPLTFEIYPDDRGGASAELYEDDGISPAYQTGVYRRTALRVDKQETDLAIQLSKPEGTWQPPKRDLLFVVMSQTLERVASIDGQSAPPTAWVTTPGGRPALRVADDGAAHRIVIR